MIFSLTLYLIYFLKVNQSRQDNPIQSVPFFLADIFHQQPLHTISSKIDQPSVNVVLPPQQVINPLHYNSFVNKMRETVEELNSLPKETIVGNKILKIVNKNTELTEFDVEYLIAIREKSNASIGMQEKDWFSERNNTSNQNGTESSHDSTHDEIDNSNPISVTLSDSTVTTNNEDNCLRTSNETHNISQGKTLSILCFCLSCMVFFFNLYNYLNMFISLRSLSKEDKKIS